jgi:hypothetical protein
MLDPRIGASALTLVPAASANVPSIRPPAVITAFNGGVYFLAIAFFLPATVRFGPLRVRALVFVR